MRTSENRVNFALERVNDSQLDNTHNSEVSLGGAIAWPSAGGTTRNVMQTSKSNFTAYQKMSSPLKSRKGRGTLDPADLNRSRSTKERQRENSSIKRRNRVIDGSYLDDANESMVAVNQNYQKTYQSAMGQTTTTYDDQVIPTLVKNKPLDQFSDEKQQQENEFGDEIENQDQFNKCSQ